MRTKSIFFLTLALGCGLVAAVGVQQVLATRERTVAAPTVEMQAIVVAMEDIPMGDPVKITQVKLEDWPKSKIPEGAIFKVENVEGRRTRTKIYKGSPILEAQLLEKGAVDAGASPWIPKGFRVVSVKVDPVSGSASMLRPSDRVDVVVHFPAMPSKGIPKDYTRTILQNVRVFAVDDKYALTGDEKTQQKTLQAKTVSLLVTPEQAEILTAATELGQIRLVMRGLGDNEPVQTKGVDPMELLGLPTQGGDPEKEHVPGTEPPERPDAFAQFLQAQSQTAPVVPVASRSSGGESWAMRLLLGPQVQEVVLELDPENRWPAPMGELWRRSSSGPGMPRSTPESAEPTSPAPSTPADVPTVVGPSDDTGAPPERGSDQ